MFEWWRHWRRKQAARNRKVKLREARGETELREFVYLDSTSVHSLIASRLGPIATEQTENEARTWESKAAGKVGADLAAFDLSASAETSRGGSQSVQVLKKSVIQTTFKDLLELEEDSLLLGGAQAHPPRKAGSIPSEKLVRGALVELDVELDVEPVFRIATVATSLVGFAERSPELFTAVGLTPQQVAQGRALEGVIRGLLGGLVPIRAKVLTHRVIRDGERLRVVPVGSNDTPTGEPLYLVGVAEEQLFWKDIRRVLFSRGRYKVLARVGEDGVKDSWTPIKLGHVLEQFVPGFSTQIQDLASLTSKIEPRPLSTGEPSMRQALLRFTELLANKAGSACSSQGMESARDHIATVADSTIVYENWKTETTAVAHLLLGPTQTTVSLDDLATLREEAKASPPRDEMKGTSDVHKSIRSTLGVEGTYCGPTHFLDCEIVAIYW